MRESTTLESFNDPSMSSFRAQVRKALADSPARGLAQAVRGLISGLGPDQRTAEAASRGLLDTDSDAEQYFWIELASEFATDPRVVRSVRTLLERSDASLANHLLVDVLAESGDPSVFSDLKRLISEAAGPVADEALAVRALRAMFVLDSTAASRYATERSLFPERADLHAAAMEEMGHEVDNK